MGGLGGLGGLGYLRGSRGLSARRVRRTKSGPKGPQIKSGPGEHPRLLVFSYVPIFSQGTKKVATLIYVSFIEYIYNSSALGTFWPINPPPLLLDSELITSHLPGICVEEAGIIKFKM